MQSLQEISRISRDTFMGLSYVLSEKGKATYAGLSKDPSNAIFQERPTKFVTKDTSKTECPMLYIKQSNHQFLMRSEVCPAYDDAGYQYMQIGGNVSLKGQDASMIAYDENKDTVGVGTGFFLRVPNTPKRKG